MAPEVSTVSAGQGRDIRVVPGPAGFCSVPDFETRLFESGLEPPPRHDVLGTAHLACSGIHTMMASRFLRTPVAMLFACALAGCAHDLSETRPQTGVRAVTPDPVGRVDLETVGRLDFDPIAESSGIVLSPSAGDFFWTHNDSGDRARIFAVRGDGSVIIPTWWRGAEGPYPGVLLEDAANIDWEDIAAAPDGTLYIGAFGNNGNARRDLAVYVLPEPHPQYVWRTRVARRIDFRLSDQDAFPPAQRSFDLEALAWWDGWLYLLSKHRDDTDTKLYRLDPLAAEPTVAEYLGRFPIGGMVTAADIDARGRMAVLTYNRAWLFTPPAGTADWFAGDARSVEIEAGQCEAIAFDGDRLVITNEGRDVYALPLAAFGVGE